MEEAVKLENEELYHYGMPRRSGRYPWGSGEDPYQHSGDWLSRVKELKKEGRTEAEICKVMELRNTSDLRRYYRIANHEREQTQIAAIKSMRGDGYSNAEIAEKLGLAGESTVRSMLNSDIQARQKALQSTMDFIKQNVDEKGIIDISKGTEIELEVSRTKLEEAVDLLYGEGYEVYNIGVENVTNPQHQTITQVICKPGTTYSDAYNQPVASLNDYISDNDGESFRKAFLYPSSMDSSRLKVRYAEEGGIDKDGLIEIRRGVDDLSLGGKNYSQVRIMVDGTHYIKGMAVYSDGSDMPDGVDVIFNTNKSLGTPVTAPKGEKCVLKEIKDDPDNPFGSLIKEHGGQSFYDDPNGKYTDPVTGKKQSLSLINKRADEGDWGEWSKELPSQFLSKQNQQLIDRQIALTLEAKQAEYDEIMAISNPTIRRKMLIDYADACDKQAEELKTMQLPRQRYQVILPLTTLKDGECYAPNYRDGEQLALIRYPHAGIFEIPIVTVNNKNAEGKKYITPNALDAIGIKKKTADQLSGADFDGDTVTVIPLNGSFKVNHRGYLEQLQGFDPKLEYAYRDGMKILSKQQTGKQMGIVTNLITDMSLQDATDDELARAVKHSMVVIDANKHKLDYTRSYEENGIKSLINKYQIQQNGHIGGASSLLSRSTAEVRTTHRQGAGKINLKDKPWYDPTKPIGSIVYKEQESYYIKSKGLSDETKAKIKELRKQKVPTIDIAKQLGLKANEITDSVSQMSTVSDARSLISSANTPQEQAYAKLANSLKRLGEKARITYTNTPRLKYSPEANEKYKSEVDSLDNKLKEALRNAPRERAAQRLANQIIDIKKQEDPRLANDNAALKKVKQQALVNARLKVGAKGVHIDISDSEWKAIQAGAISDSKLSEILLKADQDRVYELAMPPKNRSLTTAQTQFVKSMSAKGYTNAEIADRLNVSTSTISNVITGKD